MCPHHMCLHTVFDKLIMYTCVLTICVCILFLTHLVLVYMCLDHTFVSVIDHTALGHGTGLLICACAHTDIVLLVYMCMLIRRR